MANNKNIAINTIVFPSLGVKFPISLKYVRKEAWPEIIRKCESIKYRFFEILERITEPYESYGTAVFLRYKIKLPIEVIEKIDEHTICQVIEIMKTHIFHEKGKGKPSDLLFLEISLMKIEQNILNLLKMVNNNVLRALLEGLAEELAEIQKQLIDLRLFVFRNLK